jgi:hypothetical protein
MTALGAGVGAFRESLFHPDSAGYAGGLDWEDYGERAARYVIYAAMRGNRAYRESNRFAAAYKAAYGLYKHTRGVYNPAARIVEFHVAHVMGGPLDPMAGDGMLVPTACPIVGVDDAVRPAIARLFADSRWASKKNLYVRHGAMFGDAALVLRDDADRGRVMIEPLDPSCLYDVQRDSDGATLGYTRAEMREDPRPKRDGQLVEYREDCSLDRRSGLVSWWTYLDGREYPWNGVNSAWSIPLGFVPLWTVQHIDVGRHWGESELEVGRAKFDEVNDVGSKLHDQIRKLVEGAWMVTGATPQRERKTFRDEQSIEDDEDGSEAGRQTQAFLWVKQETARPHSLVNPIDVAGVSGEIRQTLDSLEDDYPELRFERLRTGGTISGEALRIARQPAGIRVQDRRPAYDGALGRAIRGGLALGGWRRYEGYESFEVDDYRGPRLADLAIGDRPVFQVDVMDRLAEHQRRFEAVAMARSSGIPTHVAMRLVGGFSEADIRETERAALEAATVTTEQPEKNASY